MRPSQCFRAELQRMGERVFGSERVFRGENRDSRFSYEFGAVLSDCVTQEMDPERLYEAGG